MHCFVNVADDVLLAKRCAVLRRCSQDVDATSPPPGEVYLESMGVEEEGVLEQD
jgi:hypothetical protein